RSVDWTFLNPKVGLTYTVVPALSLYGSLGANTREPARSDMFAGFDNLDTSNAAFVGDLRRVRPERVRDLEAGTMFHTSARDLQPLLTPRATAYGRAAFATSKYLWLAADLRYTGESFLGNNGDARFVLPAATTLDLSASLHQPGFEILFRANNVTDSRKYGS